MEGGEGGTVSTGGGRFFFRTMDLSRPYNRTAQVNAWGILFFFTPGSQLLYLYIYICIRMIGLEFENLKIQL